MNLITDRTSLDVERWLELKNKNWNDMSLEERQEWLGEIVTTPSASKGMYTYRDLNRVEITVGVLSERLTKMGYKHTPLVIKTDWTYRDDIWRQDMERYLSNLSILRDSIKVFATTPSVPSINDNLNYESANDIEKILVDIDTVTTNVARARNYVGEIMSGEV